jgi:hypothetical protein
MSKSIRIPALAKIAAELEAKMDASRPADDADATMLSLAWCGLAHAVHDALDALAAIGGRSSLGDMADASAASRMDALMSELAATLPPLRGGAPDDFEEIDPDFVADPDAWPAGYDAEGDGWRRGPDHDGPTPVEVLAMDEPAWEPSDADWEDMFRMSDASLTEADHMVVHGCV